MTESDGDAGGARPRKDSIPQTEAPDSAPPVPPSRGLRLLGLLDELINHPTYEVLRELGRGAMGVVYLARNKMMDRPEVLKVMLDRFTNRDEVAQRFIKEVQLAARVVHPNIATAYAAFRAGDALVLAMEYVDGSSLAEVVATRGPLPTALACHYARQVALGLQRAHEHGMVHRDVKPQNLMVTRRGKVKILDFGLAKITSEQADVGLTRSGASMGTPEYMPPEQALDAKSADIRADIYSLGCTLFFLLTGKPPFAGRSSFEVMQAHQSQPAPALAGLRPRHDELAQLIARMLAKQPRQRPQTPGEVAQALAPFCKGNRLSEKAPPPRDDTDLPPALGATARAVRSAIVGAAPAPPRKRRPAAAARPGTVVLFDGSRDSLERHWSMPTTHRGRWEVSNGALVGTGGAGARDWAILATKREDLGDFLLHVELAAPGGRGAFVMIRTAIHRGLISGYQVALGGAAVKWEDLPMGSVQRWDWHAEPSRPRAGLGLALRGPSGDVPAARGYGVDIESVGGVIRVRHPQHDGRPACEYTDSADGHPPGHIRLYVRSGATVRFTRIELREAAAPGGD